METSNTGIDQCIKAHLVNLKSRFSKYFPEAVSNKYKWITDPFHADSSPNFDSSLEEEYYYIDIISDTSLKDQFPKKSYKEFWEGTEGEFPHLRRKALNNLLPFTTSYLCETGSAAVRDIKTKCPSIMHLEMPLEQPFQNSNLGMTVMFKKANTSVPLIQVSRVYFFQCFKLKALNNIE
jgi:hypothetical protein